MAKNVNIWIVVALVLLGIVVASAITASITGNIIKVQKSVSGTEVYTKAEVDSKITQLYNIVIGMNVSLTETSMLADCWKYDFNCDAAVNTADAVIINDLWKTGYVISINSATTQKCGNLANYLGGLWKAGKTEIPLQDTTAIATKIIKCSESYYPILP